MPGSRGPSCVTPKEINDLVVAAFAWIYEKALAAITQPAGGVGIIETLGSGYSVEEDRMDKVAKLTELCRDAVHNPDWVAHDITGDKIDETFCNRAAASIAQGMGSLDLREDMTANRMILGMSALPDWREEFDLDRVEKLASRGVLVMLCAVGARHGHIVAAAPYPAEESSTWGCKVPMVAQVGTAKIGNGIKKLSAAFRADDRADLRIFIFQPSEA